MNGRASEPSQSNPSDNKCTKDIGKEESIKAMKDKRGKKDPLHHNMYPFPCSIVSTANSWHIFYIVVEPTTSNMI
jgi:hypothetical protein